MAACGRGAQPGIFIKGHQALESSGLINTVVFDKTGTVTNGRMTVTALAAAPGTEPAELLRHAAAVEHASEHPVAAAICAAWERAAEREGLAGADGSRLRWTPSGRCRAWARAAWWRAARSWSAASCCAAGSPSRPGWPASGRSGSGSPTAVLVGWDGQLRGAVAVGDAIKPSAAAAVAGLRRLGLRPVR